MKWELGEYEIDTDSRRLDIDKLFFLLSNSYWAKERPRATVEESIKHSLNFGIYKRKEQIGFARVITDKAVFSWLMDVIIEDSYRGEGLGKWLVQTILEHPDVKLTSIGLATKDAHTLYEKYGFEHKEMMRRPRP
ncbi:GNAT family N-acetyltransferase [Radiobacillus deserti]|uniref:GNAT family N-acetyltransferase n=1 Tax=Radiobacillus deserti TaxID=2594883 RepID=A0A516KE77_9BACI|nr:GNAT family N-acetyltransferase [Radiobacillus deserti]QDP39712.1 GNAT family N-acetyltransferase [Radiobacillus deserti]